MVAADIVIGVNVMQSGCGYARSNDLRVPTGTVDLVTQTGSGKIGASRTCRLAYASEVTPLNKSETELKRSKIERTHESVDNRFCGVLGDLASILESRMLNFGQFDFGQFEIGVAEIEIGRNRTDGVLCFFFCFFLFLPLDPSARPLLWTV